MTLELFSGVLGGVVMVLALLGIGVRHRSHRAPFAVIGASLMFNGILSLGPLARQAWSESASIFAGWTGAAAAVWLVFHISRTRRGGES